MTGPPVFGRAKAIVGMIHVGALPGTPRAHESLAAICQRAAAEAEIYAAAGLDGVLIENMHDVPYLRRRVGPEIVAGMTAAGLAVRARCPLPLGVQILAAANRAALAVAQACGAAFIRAENFAYAHVADEGLMPAADAGPLLRYRRRIGGNSIAVFADVKKKHSAHAITADVSLAEAARTTAFFGADAVVVTGVATGTPAALEDVQTVRQAVRVPVAIGSGITADNLPAYWPHADIFIVGSFLKREGAWYNPVVRERVAALMEVGRRLRGE